MLGWTWTNNHASLTPQWILLSCCYFDLDPTNFHIINTALVDIAYL